MSIRGVTTAGKSNKIVIQDRNQLPEDKSNEKVRVEFLECNDMWIPVGSSNFGGSGN